MTIFGGAGMDRTIEVAALSSLAIACTSSTDIPIMKIGRTINRFLKKQVFLGYFGSLRSTVVANPVV